MHTLKTAVCPTEVLSSWTLHVKSVICNGNNRVHELAAVLGIESGAVYRRLSGSSCWTLPEYFTVCQHLGLPVDPWTWIKPSPPTKGKSGLANSLGALASILKPRKRRGKVEVHQRAIGIWADGLAFWAASEPALDALYAYAVDKRHTGGFECEFDLPAGIADRREQHASSLKAFADLRAVRNLDIITGPRPLIHFERAVRSMTRDGCLPRQDLDRIATAGQRAINDWIKVLTDLYDRGVRMRHAEILPTSQTLVVTYENETLVYTNYLGEGLVRVVNSRGVHAARREASAVLQRSAELGPGGRYNLNAFRRDVMASWNTAISECRERLTR